MNLPTTLGEPQFKLNACEEEQALNFFSEGMGNVFSSAMNEINDGTSRKPAIVNIVCSFDTNTELDLKKIASGCSNVQYSPKRFTALIMRRTKPKATALVFKTGRVVVVGCQNIENARKMSRLFARILKKHAENVKYKQFKIYNIVSNARLPYRLNLSKLKRRYNSDEITQTNDKFPGLHIPYNCKDSSKISVTLFSTGSIVFMGAKKEDNIQEAFTQLQDNLREFQCTDEKKDQE